jgi:hypothetical protein
MVQIKKLAKSYQVGTIVLSGSFAPNGTSAVSSSSVKGVGFTVARTNAGIFTVTLDKVYGELVSANATVQLATPADTQAQIGSVSLSGKTVVINTLTAGSLADIAADANNRVNFVLVVRDTTI